MMQSSALSYYDNNEGILLLLSRSRSRRSILVRLKQSHLSREINDADSSLGE